MRRSITRTCSSSSSSNESSSSSNYQPTPYCNFSNRNIMKSSSSSELSIDLRLGLNLSTSNLHHHNSFSSPREEAAASDSSSTSSLFVKVKMEGIRIGRKVDLLAHSGYIPLITTLQHMFTTPNILWAQSCDGTRSFSHVLTYEDREGDWMMVGDVPWEMFLTTVKRLKITRTDTS